MFVVIGYIYRRYGTLMIIAKNGIIPIVTALIVILGFVLFNNIISFCFLICSERHLYFKDRVNAQGNLYVHKLIEIWDKRPFRNTLLFLLICYLPYILASYPAIFWGDTPSQIAQGYNVAEECSNYLNLLSEDVKINAHHPVFHTMLIHFFLMIGQNMGSLNVGVFMYGIMQLSVVVLTISFIMNSMMKNGIDYRIRIGLLAYYSFAPRLQNHLMLMTKDIIYGVLFTLYIYWLFYLNQKKTVKRRVYIGGIIVSCLLMLFRNEGIYIVFITSIVCLIFINNKKKAHFYNLFAVFLLKILLTHIIFPMLLITPGSKREMMSVPFQQTARYVKEYSSELSDEERETIDKILDVNIIGELYIPERVLPVKGTFRENASKQEIQEYFKVWAKLFIKHPMVYIDATLNHTYQYFYPFGDRMGRVPYKDSEYLMEATNKLLDDCDLKLPQIRYPVVFNRFRGVYEKIGELLARIPILDLFSRAAFYLWVAAIYFFYLIFRNNKIGIILLLPILIQFLVCFAGPTGGVVFRYIYPMAFSLAPTMIWGNLSALKYKLDVKEMTE